MAKKKPAAKPATAKPAKPKRTPAKKATPAKASGSKATTPGKRTRTPTPAAAPTEDEPISICDPLTSPPDAPETLGVHGLRCWRRIAPLLVEHRLLTPLDLEALEALCHQWNEYITWQLAITEDPDLAVVNFENGVRQKSPEATFRDSAYDRWLRLLPRFGLAPEYLAKVRKITGSGGGTPAGRSAKRSQAKGAAIGDFAARKYGSQ